MDIPRNDMRQAMHDMKSSCPEAKAMGAIPYACRKDVQACVCKQAKPVVLYEATEDDFITEGMGAYIRPINHPSEWVSNKKFVLTSIVISHDKETDEFETLNTIYRPAK